MFSAISFHCSPAPIVSFIFLFYFSPKFPPKGPLSDNDLAYLGDKLGIIHSQVDNKPITFHRFAKVLVCFIFDHFGIHIKNIIIIIIFKQNLRDDVNFSFWEWFFLIMQLIKQKLIKFWDEG